jgi:hypothetical protein
MQRHHRIMLMNKVHQKHLEMIMRRRRNRCQPHWIQVQRRTVLWRMGWEAKITTVMLSKMQ